MSQLQEKSESRIYIKTKGVISTQDNLNSLALFDICKNLGLNYDVFLDHRPFIDKILLAKRNSIAHGENIFVTTENIDEVSKSVVDCIDLFRNELENSAVGALYKRNLA